VIVERVKSETSPLRGYDAESMEYVDKLKAGIIDPTRWSGWRCRTRRRLHRCC
jgi:hypothetical protein